jgi:hypothetical protein
MAAISFEICEVPVCFTARSPRLLNLLADYFRYYQPRRQDGFTKSSSALLGPDQTQGQLTVELKTRRLLPAREQLIPKAAELLSQTGIVELWREPAAAPAGERFYFYMGTAAYCVDPRRSCAEGLITQQAFIYPEILANTYTLFALLLLLRSRNIYHLHAAAVISPRKELFLLCGEQRSGKTTLTAALGLAGWQPISDDSLLLCETGSGAQLSVFKKSFHLPDQLLTHWRALTQIPRYHHYLDRTCVAGLEFFGTRQLAEARFGRIDYLVFPQITPHPSSQLSPLPLSEAILKLAEQSIFFQIWRAHTEQQLKLLIQLAGAAHSYRLWAGADLLANPLRAAEILESAVEKRSAQAITHPTTRP